MINVKIDSRKVTKGDTFVAINGHTVDGHDYVQSAIENGAVKVVIEHDMDVSVEKVIVDNSEKWLADFVSNNYAKDVNEMNILGITGTNGKTTTAYLTYQMLNKLGSKTAYIGTIGYYVPNEDKQELPNTTPNILDLYELLLDAKNKDCKNVIMEVSSHSLDMGRVKGINFKVAAFTNLTQDHLDYHKTMENYLKAKMLILKQLDGPIIVNSDDNYADSWYKHDDVKKLGYNGVDYKIVSYEDLLDGTNIEFKNNEDSYKVKTNLKSEFNVYNYLTALAFVNNMGFSISDILAITNDIYPPKGRCEIIKVKGGIAVIDYAHTPDAVEKIITAFTLNKKGKVITVVGCGGDRDAKKRPIMGKIASDLSDYCIFTSDNPRTEDPAEILKQVVDGTSKDNYEAEIDRVSAIKKALDLINDNDVCLILGKGHEDYQIIGHEKHHLDDAEEVRKYINSL